MNNVYYEAKVRYERTGEEGLQTKVSESYLVDAVSVEEAGKRVAEELAPFISGEFKVKSIVEREYSEVVLGHGEYFWLASVYYITLDERSGKEKKQKLSILLQGNDFEEAYKHFEEHMKGSVSDFTLGSLSRMAFVDYFKAQDEEA